MSQIGGDFLDKLLNIEQDAAKRLGEQTFDGRKLVGFEMKPAKYQRSDMKHRLWVDPQTRLPVRSEYVPLDPDNPRTAWLHKTATFTFNRPLDESLFSMTPPEGYTLSEGGLLEMPSPSPPEEAALASPLIKPGIGIGEASFGMSAEEVIEALGKPVPSSSSTGDWGWTSRLSGAKSRLSRRGRPASSRLMGSGARVSLHSTHPGG